VLPRPEPVPESKPGVKSESKLKAKADPVPDKATPASQKPAQPAAAQQEQHMPILEQDDGSVLPQPFKPVDPLEALASPNPGMASVMLRQLRDMQGPMPDTSSGVAVIENLEAALKRGEDITKFSDQISSRILGDDEHNEMILRLIDSVDRDRITEILKSRARWEDFCHGCMRRGDLTVLEGMAFIGYSNTQLSGILSRIEKKRSRGEAAVGRETQDLMDSINRPTLVQNKELQRKFDEASPQEREMLRKLGFKLENALAARITKTTETQTVEIIQHDGTPSTVNLPAD
jgi:hypothetical protein